MIGGMFRKDTGAVHDPYPTRIGVACLAQLESRPEVLHFHENPTPAPAGATTFRGSIPLELARHQVATFTEAQVPERYDKVDAPFSDWHHWGAASLVQSIRHTVEGRRVLIVSSL